MLVYAVVCKMDKLIKFGLLIRLWWLILLSCKPYKTLFMHVDPERVYTCNSNVDSQVKLQTVNSQRVAYIVADSHVLVLNLIDICTVAGYKNSLSLAWTSRFYNPKPSFFIHALFALMVLFRQDKCFRHEAKIVLPEFFLHLINSIGHWVFSSKFYWSWKLVNFLILTKSLVKCWL